MKKERDMEAGVTYEEAFAACALPLWCIEPKGLCPLLQLPAEIVVDTMILAARTFEQFGLAMLDEPENEKSLVEMCWPFWEGAIGWSDIGMERYTAALIIEAVEYIGAEKNFGTKEARRLDR